VAGEGSYHLPVADATVVSSDVELELGDDRVVLIRHLGDVVTISTARRVKRTLTDALMIGGTVLLPIDYLPVVLRAVQKVARKK
jgi:hypothetical protein